MKEFSSFSCWKPTHKFKLLYLLNFLSENPNLSQHKLSGLVGVSSAQVNYYIDEGIRKGWIAKEELSRKRMTYQVTPLGNEARMNFLMESSVELVRAYSYIKGAIQRAVQKHLNGHIRRVVLFGASETGEVVSAALRNVPVEIVGVVDNDERKWGQSFGQWKVSRPDSIRELSPDGVIITSFARKNEILEQVKGLEQGGICVIQL
ncbi:MAG: winged helix-turn-helix transcriptional regulator [Nitrospirae bacterium]|nr:winged helix-turn-helix transcriptional regulator [Nitrospirota bacterium]